MTIKIKTGKLSDFFESARNTAEEIDSGKKITPKAIIWVEPTDLIPLLKPERTKLVQHLRGKRRISFKQLAVDMQRNTGSLNRDLDILSRYNLVRTYREKKPGHGFHKVVEPLFGSQRIEFKVEI
jgi:predicted transcriptional regulator